MPLLRDFFKKNALLISLLFLVYSWFFATHIVPSKISQPGLPANSDITLFTQPDDGKIPIISEIKNAKKEILIEMYLMSDKDIIKSLEDAKQKGVSVDVMLEEHPFGGGNLNSVAKVELEKYGINFKWTNPEFSLTHEKAIIIDSNKAFILNQNLTASSFSKNREYDILDKDPKDVSQIRNIFIYDWERKEFIPSESHLIISPINSRISLERLINNSNKSIDIETEDINDNEIVSLLSEKAKTRTVRLIAPTILQISSNKNSLTALKQNGVLVKTLSSPYIHAKLVISDNKNAYIGSVNFSSQSMDENRELGIIVSELNIIRSLSSTFQKDWSSAKDFSIN